MRDRQGQRVKVSNYVFDSDYSNGVVIKWEGDTDIVHGIEPFAHLSPALKAWGYDARFIEPMKDIIGYGALDLFTEKLNLKRPGMAASIRCTRIIRTGSIRRRTRTRSPRRCCSWTTRTSATAACS